MPGCSLSCITPSPGLQGETQSPRIQEPPASRPTVHAVVVLDIAKEAKKVKAGLVLVQGRVPSGVPRSRSFPRERTDAMAVVVEANESTNHRTKTTARFMIHEAPDVPLQRKALPRRMSLVLGCTGL